MTNREKITSLCIINLTLLFNMIGLRDNIDFISVILATLIDCSMLYSYLLFFKKPVATTSILILRQLVLIVQNIYLGMTFSEAIITDGILTIILMLVLIIYTNCINTKSEKVKDRIAELISFNREPFKIKLWAEISLYCILWISIISITKSESVMNISSETSVRLFAAFALLLPAVEILLLAIPCRITYIVLALYQIVKLYTAISLYVVDALRINSVLYMILEISIILYVFIKGYKIRNDKKKIKK